MPAYTEKGSGKKVSLTDRDFIAKGGEKSIYRSGPLAYCIYHDLKNVIPEAKIRELGVLTDPAVIRPISPLLDSKNRHCGETMPFVTDSYAPKDQTIRPLVLCQLFTNSFRRRHGVTNAHVVQVTDAMLHVLTHCHNCGVILVDPNETNWLVKPTLDGVYLIDTSCCQTATFPGTAIKLAIRDWTRNQFDQESDRFSLAVVLAWLWAGIHPYLASHPDWAHMNADAALEPRMRKHSSFFDPKTQFNTACRPLAEIPEALRRWLQATLHDGRRDPPPAACGAALASVVIAMPAVVSVSGLTVEELARYSHDVLAIYGRTVVLADDPRIVIYTPVYDFPINARVKGGQLELTSEDGTPIPVTCQAKSLFVSGGRLYVVAGPSVGEVVFNELGNKTVRATIRQVGTVADLPTTRVFSGCAVQNLLGRYLLSTFPDPGQCRQYQLRELEGWQILSAKYEGDVFAAMVESGGKYRLWVYRLQGSKQDAQPIASEFGEVNFCVTSRGVCVLMEPDGHLRAFLADPSASAKIKRVVCPVPDATLFFDGAQVLAARGPVVSKLTLS